MGVLVACGTSLHSWGAWLWCMAVSHAWLCSPVTVLSLVAWMSIALRQAACVPRRGARARPRASVDVSAERAHEGKAQSVELEARTRHPGRSFSRLCIVGAGGGAHMRQ